MSVWNKDVSGYVWPWLEPVVGVILLCDGIKTIVTHEYRYRFWVYHGVTAEFGGGLMCLASFLFFRGKIWRKRGWESWTMLDKAVGAVSLAGFLYFVVLRWISILS